MVPGTLARVRETSPNVIIMPSILLLSVTSSVTRARPPILLSQTERGERLEEGAPARPPTQNQAVLSS